ncbi:MAG TPA: Gfo/Idh/MocA family oxidoreductase [Nitrososphaera sp.]|nr:Gfo/Idh/MocA family oxidoreductase [Nitrososphaera sp.]
MKNKSSYDFLANISSLRFEDKSVLIIGAGWMARQYATALSKMMIRDVTIISKRKDSLAGLCREFGFQLLIGGYEKYIPSMKRTDLVIVATPIHHLLPAAMLAAKHGQQNILIEKPASLYREELISAAKSLKKARVRVAYNRLLYPNLHKLKQLIDDEGGVTSCRFTFTEWVHTIDFAKESRDVYSRWGIANSLHVIAMAFDLVGFPKEISTYQHGGFDWHPSGSVFVGSGVTERGIPFSYHADWNSAGRWGIEVMTAENAYRLMPLEDLYACKKGSTNWEKVPFDVTFPDVKQGVAEEVAAMLGDSLTASLVPLETAAAFNKAAEKIFGYK